MAVDPALEPSKRGFVSYNSSLREIAAGSVMAMGGFGMSSALQYLLWILVSRFWGASGLGLFAPTMAVLWIGGSLLRWGLSNATLRYVALLRSRDQGGGIRSLLARVGGFCMVSSVLGGAILFLLGDALGHLFHKPDLIPMLRVAAIAFPVWNLLSIAIFALQGLRRMGWLVGIRDITQPGLALVAIVLAKLLGADIVGGTLAYAISFVPVLLLAIVGLNRLLEPAAGSSPPLREVLAFAFPLTWTQLVAYGVRQQEVLLLTYFMPAAQVGLYGAALRTAAMVGMVLNATQNIFAPLLAHLHGTGDLDLLRRLYRTVSRWAFTIAYLVFLAFALFGVHMLRLFGNEFRDAWLVLVLLSGGQLVNVATGAAGSVLIMGARQKLELFNTAVGFLLGLVLDILLIPHLGIVGAAIGAFCSMSALNLIRVWQVRRLWGANPFSAQYFKPLAAGVVAAGITYMFSSFLRTEMSLSMISSVAMGLPVLVALYAAILGLFGLQEEDREVVAAFKSRARRRRSRVDERPPLAREPALEEAGPRPEL